MGGHVFLNWEAVFGRRFRWRKMALPQFRLLDLTTADVANETPANAAGSSQQSFSVGFWCERCCEELFVHFADLFGFGNERFIARLHVIRRKLHRLVGGLQTGEVLEISLVRPKRRFCIIEVCGCYCGELFL